MKLLDIMSIGKYKYLGLSTVYLSRQQKSQGFMHQVFVYFYN